MKTRIAYGYHKESGKTLYLGDTVEAALKANMMYKEYEKQLIEANPQLEITIKIESKYHHKPSRAVKPGESRSG